MKTKIFIEVPAHEKFPPDNYETIFISKNGNVSGKYFDGFVFSRGLQTSPTMYSKFDSWLEEANLEDIISKRINTLTECLKTFFEEGTTYSSEYIYSVLES